MSEKLEKLLEQQTQLLAMMARTLQANQQPASSNIGRQMSQSGMLPLAVQRQKVGTADMITMPPPDLSTPAEVYEYFPIHDPRGPYGGFFQDCALQSSLINLVVHPVDGLAARLPVRPNNTIEDKFGFMARYDIYQPDGQTEGGVCEPAPYLQSDLDFIKMRYAYGRLARSMNTIDMNNLILEACRGAADNFFIVGDWRGVGAPIGPNTFFNDGVPNRDLITASAIRRKLAEIGTYMQQWILNRVWTGDPANSTGPQTKEFYGLYRLINGKYSTSNLPLENTSGANTPPNLLDALSSIVVPVNKTVGSGDWSLWRTLIDTERVLYQRAQNTGMLPVNWDIYMPPQIWAEMTKHIACEMVADGCVIPGGNISKTLNMNDGGLALFNIQARQQLENSQSLTLNGRTYNVVLDQSMPYETLTTGTAPNKVFTGYKGDIFFIPFTVAGGEQVLYWEHLDYSQIADKLQPLAGRALDAKGWTDGGVYQTFISTLRNCIELQVQFEPRLIFKAPQLAARLDGISVLVNGQWPLPFDGDGNKTSWLIPPVLA